MKRIIAGLLSAIAMCSTAVMPAGALNIYDSNGDVVGTSVLTAKNSSRVYTLVVDDLVGSDAYGAIYLYDSNGNCYSGGWDGYYSHVSLTKGNSSVAPAEKNIRSSVQGYDYIYYNQH